MKTYVSIFALTFALTIATATQARAQVEWSSPASSCVLQTVGQGLAHNDAVFGTVSFAPGKHGDIKLTCPVHFLSSEYGTPSVNAFNITFYNDHGFDGGVNHCYIRADLLRSNLNVELGWDISSIVAANQSFTGRSTLFQGTSEVMDFQSNYYWADIQLHRDSSTATCNPVLVGAFLDSVIP